MRNLNESGKALRELLSQRIVVLDGAMGTMLQQHNLSAADFGGPALEGCNENLVRTRPDVVLDIHRKYLEAGSDIIETNSFGGTPIVLADRKSTRLNSSHSSISYAVFCLKKKRAKTTTPDTARDI